MINHINFILLVKLNKIMQILVSSLYYLLLQTKESVYIMLIIPIKDGENIDRALKRYKENLIKQNCSSIRARTAFIKPSVTNRIKIQKRLISKI
jgi:small subunit ribosomal protein S21